MNDEPTKVPIPMVANKNGLAVPADQVKPDCGHMEVVTRFTAKTLKKPYQEFKCKDCEEHVQLRVMNFVVLTPEKMKAFELFLAHQQSAAMADAKRKQVGIVLPGQQG